MGNPDTTTLNAIRLYIDHTKKIGAWTVDKFAECLEAAGIACKGDLEQVRFVLEEAEPDWLEELVEV